jgi:uncharacterized membrane protein (DUF106 family)
MMIFNGFLDPFLSPLLSLFGIFWFVVFISFIVTLLTTLVYKFTTDQLLMKNLKEEIDRLNKEVKKHMHDQKKAMSIHKQMFEKQMTMMKHSFTSTFITLLPIILLFNWLRVHLGTEKILNLYFFQFGWLGSYILFAIIFSIVLRKLLKVY